MTKGTVKIIEMKKDQNIEFIIEEIDEPEVPTEFQKVQQAEADIYYKFRYTFEQDDTDPQMRKLIMRGIINDLRRFMIGGKYTAAIECFSVGMVPTKPHCHIHFVSRTKKDTIRKWLKRHDDCARFVSNRCYAISVEVDVKIEKFWRYPLKQQKGDTHMGTRCEGFEPAEIVSMRDAAYEIWKTAAEVQNKKIEKKENADQLSDRLFEFLDKLGQKDDKSLKIGIQQFYIVEEQRPFNKTTALGYFYNYKITRKLMTHEQLANTW